MHVTPESGAPAGADPGAGLPWYRGLTAHHWFVLVVCWLGWLFDTMDQQLFIMSRTPAMVDLVKDPKPGDIAYYAGLATMFLVLGWATGGIVFGVLGDRWGRAKTLVLAVLFYSVFTGLSALSVTWMDFSLYRFLTGMGVGGTFAAAVSMVAETLPARSRPYALGFLQVLAALGNVSAAALSLVLKPSAPIAGVAGWRLLFVVGIVPAVLVMLVMRRLKEPESWVKAREARARGDAQQAGRKMGSLKELFGDPRWRRNVIVGILLGLAGVIGLWGIGFWLPELVRTVNPVPTAAALSAAQPGMDAAAIKEAIAASKANQDWYCAIAMMLFNGAAAVGTYLFALLVGRIGRRPAFALVFAMALVSVFVVFGFMTKPSQIWWMAPLLGLGTLTVFGGYSIYFPELFPTRLRASGVGFCYNTARYVAAPGSFALGALSRAFLAPEGTTRFEQGLSNLTFLSSMGSVDHPIRYGAIVVSLVFVVGLLVLPFAPETKGKPLPE
jgi:MFS family permease